MDKKIDEYLHGYYEDKTRPTVEDLAHSVTYAVTDMCNTGIAERHDFKKVLRQTYSYVINKYYPKDSLGNPTARRKELKKLLQPWFDASYMPVLHEYDYSKTMILVCTRD